jgi:hypothetical protein
MRARYTQALAELAAGYVMRQPGYSVDFGPQLNGLTPDIIVTDPGGPRLIVEVWRRVLSRTVAARNAQWAELGRQVRRIAIPVLLAVASTAPGVVEPPDAASRRRIEQSLRRWLVSGEPRLTPTHVCQDLVFRVVGRTTTGCAEILPVRDGATADRKDVVEAIERKVRRYRRVAEELDLPLLVVLSADPDTVLDASHVGSILAGQNSVAMTLPVFGVGAINSGPIELRRMDTPPVFDPALSAVAWLEINDGVHATLAPLWPNPRTTRPVEPLKPPTA